MKTVRILQKNKFYLIALANILMLSQSLQVDAYQAPYHDNKQMVTYQPNGTQRFTISIKNYQIVLSNNKNYRQVLVDDISSIPKHIYDIWVSDFNYDGFSDIAIATEENEDGLNEIYTLFCWDPLQQQVRPMKGLSKVSNPELLPAKKELKTVSRSSTRWIEKTYRFHQGTAYVYKQTNMLLPMLWQTSIFSKNGKITDTILSKDGQPSQLADPIVMPITHNQAWLYKKPLPSTKTQHFLERNDPVTILDYYRSQNHLDWILIRSHENNPVEQWILMDTINLS